MFFKAIPVPRTTALNGSSATWIGSLVFKLSLLSRPLNNAPPPVWYIPLSYISAESSGGELSKAFKTASSIFEIDLSIANAISE